MEQQNQNNQQTIQDQEAHQTDTCESVHKDGKEIKSNDIEKLLEETDGVVTIPPSVMSKLVDFIKYINNNPNIVKDMDDETKQTILSIADNIEYVNEKDIGKRERCNSKLTNDFKIDGKSITVKKVNTKLRNSNAVKLKLSEKLGVGSVVHIPLYHSGFWITVKPLTNIEKIELQMNIVEDLERVGRKTHGLVFSNMNVILIRTILEYIKDHIVDTSLVIDDMDKLYDYIKIQDIPIIITALAKSIYPNGFDFISLCKNSLSEDPDKLCNYKLHMKLDLNKLIWVDNDSLTDEHKKLLLKRSSKSVTIEDIENYQSTLEANNADKIKLNTDENDIIISISSPSITKYVEYGNLYVENIESKIKDLIRSGKLEENEDNLKKEEYILTNTLILQLYNHYIDKIIVDDIVMEDVNDIMDILELLSNDKTYYEKVLNNINSYIDRSLVAIVGMPDYVCPMCGSRQGEGNVENFRTFIGIDVVKLFFTLLAFRYLKIIQQSSI